MRIFAFGDVAEHGGPRMARAAQHQSSIVSSNILSMINGRKPRKTYKSIVEVEGTLKVSIGKSRYLVYIEDKKGREVLFPLNLKNPDMGINMVWKHYGGNAEQQFASEKAGEP